MNFLFHLFFLLFATEFNQDIIVDSTHSNIFDPSCEVEISDLKMIFNVILNLLSILLWIFRLVSYVRGGDRGIEENRAQESLIHEAEADIPINQQQEAIQGPAVPQL